MGYSLIVEGKYKFFRLVMYVARVLESQCSNCEKTKDQQYAISWGFHYVGVTMLETLELWNSIPAEIQIENGI